MEKVTEKHSLTLVTKNFIIHDSINLDHKRNYSSLKMNATIGFILDLDQFLKYFNR